MKTWQEEMYESNNRFAQHRQFSETERTAFLTLGLAGEAGELANIIKKILRGEIVNMAAIAAEIGDTYNYLSMISRHFFGVNPEVMGEKKWEIVKKRKFWQPFVTEEHEDSSVQHPPVGEAAGVDGADSQKEADGNQGTVDTGEQSAPSEHEPAVTLSAVDAHPIPESHHVGVSAIS